MALSLQTEHIAKYIGEYAFSDDFAMQEQIRQSDLQIREWVAQKFGAVKAEKFFVNGWGQMLSAAHIIEKNPLHLQISRIFCQTINEEVQQAISKAKQQDNPLISQNVRSYSKSILMFPHVSQYFPFQKVHLDKPMEQLTHLIQKADLEFALYEGKFYLKINPEGEANIFNKLWSSDFLPCWRKMAI
jgi:hypothetical protein